MAKHTKMEQEALDMQRRGERVVVDKKEQAEGPPIVSLREFTETRTPEPAPGPLPPVAEGEQPLPPPPPEAEVGTLPASPVSALPTSQMTEDVEAMNASLFGTVDAEAATEESEEKPKGLFEQTQCQRCGWVLENQALEEPSDEDKLEFIESILGSRRFVKQVPILGGRLKVTFRTVLVPEEDAITTYLNEQMDGKTVQNEAEWVLAYSRARLVVMLQELDIAGKSKSYETLAERVDRFDNAKKEKLNKTHGADLVEAIREALIEVPAGWPLSIHGLLVQGMATMTEIYSVLMSRAYDPNFWEGQPVESD